MKSLYDCRNHWQWLWITGSGTKRSYEPATHWKCGCACCESMQYECCGRNKKGKYICDDCPLTGYAWQVDPYRDFAPCVMHNTGSCYFAWKTAGTKEERQYYAHKMVMACNRAIENELTNHLALKELTK